MTHHERAGEIRLTTRFDGTWNFLGGLYAQNQNDWRDTNYLWTGDPATNPYARGERYLGRYLDRRQLEQKAAFGEVSWQFAPGFTLTGGVRAYEYDQTIRTDTDGVGFNGVRSLRDVAKASGQRFRGNLSYKPNENALYYAGWGQGFRLGKPQSRPSAVSCDRDNNGIIDGTNFALDAVGPVDSDTVDSYELGGKFAILNRRVTVNAALFRMEWSGIPIAGTPNGCFIANAGNALSEGIELQANWHITEAFRVDFGGSWIHARLAEDVPTLNASKGNRLPGSPKVNANLSPQYEFAIAGYPAFVRADASYVGSFYGNVQETPVSQAGGYVKLDATARVAINTFDIDLYVRNLTNENDFSFRGNFVPNRFVGYRLRPRTIGIELQYRF